MDIQCSMHVCASAVSASLYGRLDAEWDALHANKYFKSYSQSVDTIERHKQSVEYPRCTWGVFYLYAFVQHSQQHKCHDGLPHNKYAYLLSMSMLEMFAVLLKDVVLAI
jgi:hypothetical protein